MAKAGTNVEQGLIGLTCAHSAFIYGCLRITVVSLLMFSGSRWIGFISELQSINSIAQMPPTVCIVDLTPVRLW